MSASYVVTGGGRGVGRAIAARLLEDGGAVIVIEKDAATTAWAREHAAAQRIVAVHGDAAQEAVAERAAGLAQQAGTFTGWVNNAAVFRDAWLHEGGPAEVMALVAANLAPALAGSAAAVRRFLAARTGGAIVNVSSHQAQRPVRGALPYATAKAAIEGLTRALAVDYGPYGIRVNAVALGSVGTERYQELLARRDPQAATLTGEQMRALHPLGRVARPEEVADAVAYLLSEQASFINGAVLPVDGGRAVLGPDPEAAGTSQADSH